MVSTKDYESLRKKKWYIHSNAAWNNSGVNHPSNIGYLFDAINTLEPDTYEEWVTYFKENIADDNKLKECAVKFKNQIFNTPGLFLEPYRRLTLEDYIFATECRLIYETWLGYQAEVFVIDELLKIFPQCHSLHMSPEDDNKYAVDYILTLNSKMLCGIQVKSVNYKNATSDILLKTKDMNHRKNNKFTRKYNIPVFYAYYQRARGELSLQADECIEQVKQLLHTDTAA